MATRYSRSRSRSGSPAAPSGARSSDVMALGSLSFLVPPVDRPLDRRPNSRMIIDPIGELAYAVLHRVSLEVDVPLGPGVSVEMGVRPALIHVDLDLVPGDLLPLQNGNTPVGPRLPG